MALMFQRLARNFIKQGYYPTDEATIARVLAAVEPSEQPMRILDPCCGEGVALAETAHHLAEAGQGPVTSYGVEYDEERAWHAKTLLDRCMHADLMDTLIQPRAFGLLWLNPPYGDLVSDQAAASVAKWKGRKRLEKLFYERSIGTLQFGGVLVLIVPHYALDREFSTWIARHCASVQVYRAATGQFQQIVVLGRRKPSTAGVDTAARDRLAATGTGEFEPPVLPEHWRGPRYTVPPAPQGEAKFFTLRVDPRQLAEQTQRAPSTLWHRFEVTFQSGTQAHRRPLRALSRWHLALALSAGQVSGRVSSNDGRIYLVKGDTHKEKEIRVEQELDDRTGEVRETRIHLDRFVPVIRAIDFTPDSPTFGDVLTIC